MNKIDNIALAKEKIEKKLSNLGFGTSQIILSKEELSYFIDDSSNIVININKLRYSDKFIIKIGLNENNWLGKSNHKYNYFIIEHLRAILKEYNIEQIRFAYNKYCYEQGMEKYYEYDISGKLIKIET